MFSRSSHLRVCAATVVAIALGGAAIQAQGKSNKDVLGQQPIGTVQIASLGGATSPIFGFSFSVTDPVSGSTGSGGGAGKVTVSAVDVARLPDGSSPLLFKNAVTGVHLPAVQITTFGAGKTVPDATYILHDAIVSGFSAVDGVEHVSFSYASIEILVAGSQVCFDVTANRAC